MMLMIPEYSMLSATSTTLVFGLIFLFLAKQNNEKYMALWGFSWLVYAFMFFLDFSNLTNFHPGSYYVLERQAIALMGALLFLLGTYDFFRLTPSKRIYSVTLFFFASIGLSSFSSGLLWILVMPNVIFSSFLLIWAGCLFISCSWTQNLPEKIIASFLIILWAIFLNHFGFSLMHEAMAIFNYFVGIFLVNLLILFLLIIHFKKVRFIVEKREARFRLLVENSSDSMFLYDYEKKAFQYVSPSIKPLLHVSAHELYERPTCFFENITVSQEDEASLSIFSKPIKTPSMATLRLVRDQETIGWSEMHYLPIHDGTRTIVAVEGILRDITDQKKTEESLQASEIARKELIENISHEIRTPVTLIQGYTESLLNGIVPSSSVNTYLKMIHSKTLMLTMLLEDLIQVSHFTSQTLDYKFYEQNACDYFTNLMHQAEFQIIRAGKQAQIQSRIDEEVIIILDTARIEQVVTNLINNSLRHTIDGGVITLVCDSTPNSCQQKEDLGETDPLTVPDGEIIFTVIDTGDGIDPDDLPHIFERKFQGKNAQAKPDSEKGSGLGLFISMQIMKQHSGRMWAENVPTGGAKFSFSIPYYRPDSEEELL